MSIGCRAWDRAALASATAEAATVTWLGNYSVNWADTNWNGADNPPVSNDSLVFAAAGSSGATLNDNLTVGISKIGGITFNAVVRPTRSAAIRSPSAGA